MTSPCILLLSVNLGQPEDLPDPFAREGRRSTHRTAIRKRPADAPVRLGRLGLEGDAVADTRCHGGPDQAVLAYAAHHYLDWVPDLGEHPALVPGGFGENLTVEGADETTTCLGDRWRVGEVELEVSLPRVPCETLARRFGIRDFVKRVAACARTGWYFRVLQEGVVTPGSQATLIDRPHPEWTVAEAFRVIMDPRGSGDLRRSLARCPAIPERLRAKLERAG